MSNTLIIFVDAIVTFTLLLVFYKAFGKIGAIVWVGIATVLANIITAKNADVMGLSVAVGTTMFASTFLATDILAEYHSKKDAKTAIMVGVLADVVLIVCTQIALLYKPSDVDYANDAMNTLFGLNLRISIASLVMYVVANLADVWLFGKMKELSKGKRLWLRNNVATVLCNCLENFGFIALAFAGIYDAQTIVIIAASTSVIEMVVALLDTPFLYLARRLKNSEEGKR